LSAPVPRQVLRRTLTVRFNRPYAAVAVTAEPSRRSALATVDPYQDTHETTRFDLPVFSAWVAEPAETPDPPKQPSPEGGQR
jgi:hypothetical protein